MPSRGLDALHLEGHLSGSRASQLQGETMAATQSKSRGSKVVNPETRRDNSPEDTPEPIPTATLKAFGGGNNTHWNSRIGHRLFAAIPGVNPENADQVGRAAMSGLLDINSTDPIEGMLAAQIIAAHEAALNLRQLAWLPEQHFVVQAKYLELAEKAARTMGMLTERLDQHRGRGQQQITVKHITVNADQALVADNITTENAKPLNNLLTTQKPMDILNTKSY